jgi:hypothetical protein
MSTDNAMPALICAEHILDGTAARECGPFNPERQVIEFATRVLLRLQGSLPDCVALADLMAACYHAGRRQERRRADCGLPRLDEAPVPTPDRSVVGRVIIGHGERVNLSTGAITEERE